MPMYARVSQNLATQYFVNISISCSTMVLLTLCSTMVLLTLCSTMVLLTLCLHMLYVYSICDCSCSLQLRSISINSNENAHKFKEQYNNCPPIQLYRVWVGKGHSTPHFFGHPKIQLTQFSEHQNDGNASVSWRCMVITHLKIQIWWRKAPTTQQLSFFLHQTWYIYSYTCGRIVAAGKNAHMQLFRT